MNLLGKKVLIAVKSVSTYECLILVSSHPENQTAS